MPQFKWTITFEAEDDKDANDQCDDAQLSFHSVISEDVEEVDGA